MIKATVNIADGSDNISAEITVEGDAVNISNELAAIIAGVVTKTQLKVYGTEKVIRGLADLALEMVEDLEAANEYD